LHGYNEGRQDLLLGDGRRRHEIILDETYRLVQYLVTLGFPSQQGEHPLEDRAAASHRHLTHPEP
jgi:hypothetical protein